MATTGTGQPKKNKSSPALSEMAHQQAMELYRLAEESKYPELRAAAIRDAQKASALQRRHAERLSPTLVAVLVASATVLALGACWYCFLHYTQTMAFELCGAVILFYLTFTAVLLYLAARLTERSLMEVLRWMRDHVKGWLPRKSTEDAS